LGQRVPGSNLLGANPIIAVHCPQKLKVRSERMTSFCNVAVDHTVA
jgi:hypothetical protein